MHLDLLKRLKSHFLTSCCCCPIKPDSALEKAGKSGGSWPLLCNVISATWSWSQAVDGRREMGQYTYTFVPATALQWEIEVFLPDPFPGGEKELMCTRHGTGELLS